MLFLEDDITEIKTSPDGKAAYAWNYQGNRRICDIAYNQLINNIWLLKEGGRDIWNNEIKTKYDLIREINPNTNYDDRNKYINNLKKWWSEHSSEVLKERGSIYDKYPELKEKIGILENKIKKQIDEIKEKAKMPKPSAQD
jgi:hypothetical protein